MVEIKGRNCIRSHLYLRPVPASEVDKETNATRDPATAGEVLEEIETDKETIATRDPATAGEVLEEFEVETEVEKESHRAWSDSKENKSEAVGPRRSNRLFKKRKPFKPLNEILHTAGLNVDLGL